ncbi:MAG: metallophosphoesterase [Actinobacteria bacterium]|nr:metallophosphoesterase [Actinomycetota bacterium]
MKRHIVITAIFMAVLLALLAVAPGCGNGVTESPGPSPATTPSQVESGPRFSFIVCGDPQNNYEVLNKILEAASSVEFLIIAGDMTGSGTATEFANFIGAMERSGVRYYCVPGNHDVATSPVDENYRQYLGAPYQSFNYENCHFALIDNSTPDRGLYPAECQWLKDDLEAARDFGFDHIFAVCHVPPGYPYSLRPYPEHATGMEANENLIPILAEGGVEELFCGHFHAYKQFEKDGVLVTITGGAGAPLHAGADYGGYFHYILVEIAGKQRTQKVVRI